MQRLLNTATSHPSAVIPDHHRRCVTNSKAKAKGRLYFPFAIPLLGIARRPDAAHDVAS